MLRSCHFDLEMCFGPQLRALFQQLNSQKCSDPKVCLAFWLRNVLRATAACTRHSRVYLWSFDFETGAAKLRKTQCFVTFLPFRALWSSFYLLSLIWLLPHLLLHQSISQKFHFLQIYLIIHFNTFQYILCIMHVYVYTRTDLWSTYILDEIDECFFERLRADACCKCTLSDTFGCVLAVSMLAWTMVPHWSMACFRNMNWA